MMNNYVLWLFMLSFCSVAAQRFDGVEKILSQNHCLEEGTPLRIEYPFPLTKGEPDLIVLEWFYPQGIQLLEISAGQEPNINNPRASVFGAFGLQIDDVTSDDAGRYWVSRTTQRSQRIIYIDVAILVAPKLKTKKLSLSHTFDEKKCLADLTCGTMESLGDPPVSLMYTAPNGTTYTGVYKDGRLSLTVPLTEDLANIVCELDINSTASASCIEEPPRWKTAPSATLRADYERKCAKGKDPAKGTAAEPRLHVQLNLCLILSAWISASWAK